MMFLSNYFDNFESQPMVPNTQYDQYQFDKTSDSSFFI